MPKIIQKKLKILENKKVGAEYCRMKILAPQIVQKASPGQFMHLRCNDEVEPLLRRPFSFHRFHSDSFEIFYKVIGRGTKLLAKKQKGDTIDVLAPLGNGFELERTTNDETRTTILVAGGMGVAPLLALAEGLIKNGLKAEKAVVLLGARSAKHIFCVDDFKRLGVKLYIATDDGSRGHKGLVTELLERILRKVNRKSKITNDERRITIYACGPKAMLKAITILNRKQPDVSCFGSLEENMACGVGACLGCAIETVDGYKRVCKEGPVFDLKDIKW
ncbi:MAG: dihydroorotate dehydrogenase electron transfer subunit [Candidatus Omnitrophica bacterium]|nr:dihydroorotate dehydrogenase electron transfer subunit [Candidatus Omnitrophota bacterium]